MSTHFITENPRSIPVINEVDIAVLGGGCSGVFAAIRAARLGAKVAIIEKSNAFGGVATNGMVCVWHTLYDMNFRNQIIAGLTYEVIKRLERIPNGIRITMPPHGSEFRNDTISTYHINTEELKIELDKLVRESGITAYLHTFYCAPYLTDGELKTVIVENKSGRAAIAAKYFIDATADGDLGLHLNMESYKSTGLQPATTSARVYGWDKLESPNKLLHENREEIGCDIGWDDQFPGTDKIQYWAKSDVITDCSIAGNLSDAEITGRLQIRKMMDVLREKDPHGKDIILLSLSSAIGIRETRRLKCSYQVVLDDILYGKRFDDAVVNCAYHIDIHHHDKSGATYRYLDGIEEYVVVGKKKEVRRWREETGGLPAFWQLPYRAMLPKNIKNVLICGRAIDLDDGAFSAARVMISLNQTGEAAGVAAFEALDSNTPVQEIDIKSLRDKMEKGGSVVIL